MKAFFLTVAVCTVASAAAAANGSLECRSNGQVVVATVNDVNQNEMFDCGGQVSPGENLCFRGDAKVASDILNDLIGMDFFGDEMSLYDMTITQSNKIEFTLLDEPNESTTGSYTVGVCK